MEHKECVKKKRKMNKTVIKGTVEFKLMYANLDQGSRHCKRSYSSY